MKDRIANSSAVVLTEYRGLTVKELQNLRRSLGDNVNYAVAKNTLAIVAAREAGVEGLDEYLNGPTAFAFIDGDVAQAAKSLRDFAKGNPLLLIKSGVLEGKVLTAEQVKSLADLESREVLLSKLAGAMKGSMSKAVGTFAAPLSQSAQLFGALESKLQSEQKQAGTDSADTSSADAEATTDAAADAASSK